jgi:hypothetical protein
MISDKHCSNRLRTRLGSTSIQGNLTEVGNGYPEMINMVVVIKNGSHSSSLNETCIFLKNCFLKNVSTLE